MVEWAKRFWKRKDGISIEVFVGCIRFYGMPILPILDVRFKVHLDVPPDSKSSVKLEWHGDE